MRASINHLRQSQFSGVKFGGLLTHIEGHGELIHGMLYPGTEHPKDFNLLVWEIGAGAPRRFRCLGFQ